MATGYVQKRPIMVSIHIQQNLLESNISANISPLTLQAFTSWGHSSVYLKESNPIYRLIFTLAVIMVLCMRFCTQTIKGTLPGILLVRQSTRRVSRGHTNKDELLEDGGEEWGEKLSAGEQFHSGPEHLPTVHNVKWRHTHWNFELMGIKGCEKQNKI